MPLVPLHNSDYFGSVESGLGNSFLSSTHAVAVAGGCLPPAFANVAC